MILRDLSPLEKILASRYKGRVCNPALQIWGMKWQAGFWQAQLGRLNLITYQDQSYKLPKSCFQVCSCKTVFGPFAIYYTKPSCKHTPMCHQTWQGKLATHQGSWIHLYCFYKSDAKPTYLSWHNGNEYTVLAKQSDGILSRQVG